MTKIIDSNSPLFQPRPFYRPFMYPWAYEAWLMQQRIHWLFDEVPMADDVRDWKTKLTDSERNLLTQIFRFFTQSDVGVSNCYMSFYIQTFQPPEISMMLSSFLNIETIHIAAYDHLLQTLGLPETEYQAFLKCKAMSDKWDYMQEFGGNTVHDVAMTLALFGAFTEGLQLFASFAILMNFPRFNKMKGMGQIVSWSIRDETLHIHSTLKLFHEVLREHPHLWTAAFQDKLRLVCQTVVEHEDAFIDIAFEMGDIEGVTRQHIKDYVRFIANRRLEQLGIPQPLYAHVTTNPCPWMDELNNVEFTNFFEQRVTEYGPITEGSWDEIFD